MHLALARIGTPKEGDVADALHKLCTAFLAQGLDHLVASLAIGGPDAHFHQFMMVQRTVKLGQQARCDASGAGEYYGLERVA